jgi:hypothetical protein
VNRTAKILSRSQRDGQVIALPSAPTRPKAVLMRRDEICDVKTAAYEAGRSVKTIRAWAEMYGIGRQSSPTSPIEISRIGLLMVLQGDFQALELLRNGERSHSDVLRYIREVGVPE